MRTKFIIGSTNLTEQINIKNSYKVNSVTKSTSITDANGVEHRNPYRERITGSFDMVFIDGKDDYISYADFLTLVSNNTVNGVLTCTIYVQNKAQLSVIDCYLTITIKKESDVNGYIVRIANIKIEEC